MIIYLVCTFSLVKTLQRRVTDLEKIILDLEHRLEEQAKINMDVEKECIDIERDWKTKCSKMEQVYNLLPNVIVKIFNLYLIRFYKGCGRVAEEMSPARVKI